MSPGDASRAIAYLKAEAAENESPTPTLSGDEEPILRRFTAGLLIAYVLDRGDRFEFIQRRHLHEANLSEAALHQIGVANLLAFAAEHAEVRSYGDIFVVLAGGNFEASLLLADAFWTSWYATLAQGGFVAAVPARDILAFGDAGSPAAIRELQAVARRTNATAGGPDHPLTNKLLHKTAAGWEPLDE